MDEEMQKYEISKWDLYVDSFLEKVFRDIEIDKTVSKDELKACMLYHLINKKDVIQAMTLVFFPIRRLVKLNKNREDLKEYFEKKLPNYLMQSDDLIVAMRQLEGDGYLKISDFLK